MEYLVRHRTTYRYLQEASYSRHFLHLALRATPHQRVRHSAIVVAPEPAQRIVQNDAFGNAVEWVALDEPHAQLDILAESRVEVISPATRDPQNCLRWEDVRARLEAADDAEARDAVTYIFDSGLTGFTADIASYAEKSFPAGRPLLAGAIDLMARIHADFRYDTTVTDATTPVDRVFEIRAGVCQDLAHVGIACMRAMSAAI